ncbi:MAG TPA: AAA family ATPase, partial [Bacteroidia bacterium]|nr:AAA family ATPase [Bacteroidia bacterium]
RQICRTYRTFCQFRYYHPSLSMFNGDQILRENQNTKTIFEQTILKNYGIRQNLVFTGNDLYHRIKQDRNNIKSVRVQFEKFEAFLSRAFFQNKQVELIAKESEKAEERHINVWIDGIERELHNVGDGIQSLITLMYPIFMAPEKSWIFIEEPETHLHPGLQRIFIEELISNEEFQKKELKVLLTTHSNHLIDQSFQNSHKISLFSCKRELREGIETVNVKQITTPQNQLLSDLGVKNSSVFLASCTLWIEGICDRIIIRKLIKLKSEQQNKILLEDIDFAFFEYAGSNLSHYLFSDNDSNNNLEELEEEDQKLINAFALSNNILLIADKDKGKLSKHLMYNEIERTGFSYYTLQVREIENSLSPGQLRQYLPKLFNRIPIDNWNSILENVKEDDYMDEYLGTFLKQKAEKSNLKIPKSLIAKSGTLETRYKTKLAQEFTNGHVTWNELSSSAKKLADRVYEYIIEAKK